MDSVDFHLSQILKTLGMSQPVGFMLSYEFGDVWVDIYFEKELEGWNKRIYTVSVPKARVKALQRLAEGIGCDLGDVVIDEERAYLSLSSEDWDSVSPDIMSLL